MVILPSWDHDTKHNLCRIDTGRQTTDRTRNVATRIRLDEARAARHVIATYIASVASFALARGSSESGAKCVV